MSSFFHLQFKICLPWSLFQRRIHPALVVERVVGDLRIITGSNIHNLGYITVIMVNTPLKQDIGTLPIVLTDLNTSNQADTNILTSHYHFAKSMTRKRMFAMWFMTSKRTLYGIQDSCLIFSCGLT